MTVLINADAIVGLETRRHRQLIRRCDIMTYAFDEWMKREHPNSPFSRYADDAVAHCRSEAEAKKLLAVIDERLKECKLEMHPEKSGIVYCKDSNRRQREGVKMSFDFLGYTFRPRITRNSQRGE